jgi:hypothetical protein
MYNVELTVDELYTIIMALQESASADRRALEGKELSAPIVDNITGYAEKKEALALKLEDMSEDDEVLA